MRSLTLCALGFCFLAACAGKTAKPAFATSPPATPSTLPAVASKPSLTGPAVVSSVDDRLAGLAAGLSNDVLGWRRRIHQHPELSNREVRTAAMVAEHLRSLGLEVRTKVAQTGVVGVLRGARPGRVVALRADMDALPVTENTGLPFASQEKTEYRGQKVGVMHACGHDAHTAMLMGAASLLAGLRETLSGTVVFVFQPAEEGPPPGEKGGALQMIAEGVLRDPPVEAIFGLHVLSQYPTGTVAYVSGGAMASSDKLYIRVLGKQTHAAYPWLGIDPILAASRIVVALQAIPSRQIDVRVPSVVSIGTIHGGIRHNIIPDMVEMSGTLRALDPQLQEELQRQVRQVAQRTASINDAKAEVNIVRGYPVTYNDPELTARMLPTLQRHAPNLVQGTPLTVSEDFSAYQQHVPGFYYWLGVRAPQQSAKDAAPNHSPAFLVDEAALVVGVRTLAALAADYLATPPSGG